MLKTSRLKAAPAPRARFMAATALIALLCLFMAALPAEAKTKIDLINPGSGLLGFQLGLARDLIAPQAKKLGLEHAETRILREDPEDLFTDFYTGKVWGREALVYISSRGARVRNIAVKYELFRQGEEFAESIRKALQAALGAPNSSAQRVNGRQGGYIRTNDTSWRYGDLAIRLSARSVEGKKGTEITLSCILTTIQ